MIRDVYCPFCETEFEVDIDWGDTKECPNCKEEFFLDECCTEDFSDCWASIEWYNL